MAVFLVIAVLGFVVGVLVDQRRARARVLRERLDTVQKTAEPEPSEELALVRVQNLSGIPALDTILRKSDRISNLQTTLEQGNVGLNAGNIILLCLASGAVLGFLVFLIPGFQQFAPLGVIFGSILPYTYANYRRSKRFQKFEEMFPEAIDTLARAVRAGHAFTTALEMIANELSEPVASEFRKLFEEQKFGLPVRDALMNLTQRVPLWMSSSSSQQ